MSVSLSKSTTEGKKRAVSLDLARGTMLLLIALAHAPLYLYASDPGIMHRVEGITFLDQAVNFFGQFIIDNRARAMFAVLFGYGLVLAFKSQLSKGTSEKEAVKTIRRRSWYLILFGIILIAVIGGQDILIAYGITGLLVSWVLTRTNKTLIRTFVLITVLYVILTPLVWSFLMQATGSYGLAPGVSATDTYLNTILIKLISVPIIPIFIHVLFPVLPSVLIGIWIARYQLLSKPEPRLKSMYLITITGLIVSLLGAIPLSLIGNVWNPSYFTAGLTNGIHIITGIAGGLAYATLFGIIGAKIKEPGRITSSLMALGKRSLTFYVLNEALLVLFLSPVALNLGGQVGNGIAAIIAVGIWVLSVVLATILEKRNRTGPLEVLMRRLVYKKK
ncbi:DUF418 domain-containing protein [Paenibacillus sp. SC116]|uniref:DUF418 domain-containing protein n=1 Tax=Paenibacillus sp. SC116 TaxID=2968986 RepID=UPI00215A3908|nr:DUF418 domain-containing protein [Paenibacillus sp. SC116]MCR8844464.1 DUF418 domain-containing protein [Paenibacillus sp. SC116]